ncbi:unnamed protein product [Moneuplotes crassus]|uniref:Uncharacterized protein n=1 Tax=Euplotes crassus TaxID=5936 RepID=A0AAD1XXS8_EUPCR|nr:unnamed protein product [Moneuplotes crassus]
MGKEGWKGIEVEEWVFENSRGRMKLGLKSWSWRNGAHPEPQLHFRKCKLPRIYSRFKRLFRNASASLSNKLLRTQEEQAKRAKFPSKLCLLK